MSWGHVLWVVLLAAFVSLILNYIVDGFKDWRRKKRSEL